MNFEPGDVVQLKSGGPKMTVLSEEDGTTCCNWYDEIEKKFRVSDFGSVALKKVDTKI